MQAIEAVGDLLDRMTAFAQRIGEVITRLLIILDDEHSHAALYSTGCGQV
jgi:hypothetical protein